MLTGCAAAHQHPFNIFVHMIGIPTIMLGILIPLTCFGIEIASIPANLAHVVMPGFLLFYLTLDALIAVVFLIFALLIAQFVGHAVGMTMPGLVKHPIQANLAAPFFTVVKMIKLPGLRVGLYQQERQETNHEL